MRTTNQNSSGLRSAIAALVISAQLFSAQAMAMDNFFRNPCPPLFAKVFAKKAKPSSADYLSLNKKPVAEYFPESETLHPHPGVEIVGAKISPEALLKFHQDFDALLDQREATFGFPARKFREWLKKKNGGKPYPTIDPVYMELAFKQKNFSLEDVQNAYFMSFAEETQGRNLAGFFKKLHVRDIGRLAVTLTKSVGGFSGTVLKGALIAGPIAGIVNGFVSAPTKPIIETAEQSSNILFASVAQAVQKFASARMGELKQSVSDVKSTTEALDQYNFEGMDPKEAKKIMDQFEERYYKLFLRVSGFMPPYKRAGRDVVRDWLINQPLLLANHASTFNSEFTMNRGLLSALEDKIKARGTPATPEELDLIEDFKTNMETAENRLAVTLASWKLYTFTFAEVARLDPNAQEIHSVMMNTLGRYQKFMNMDKYRKELSSKVKEAFHNFDPSFTGLDQLQHPSGKE